MGRPRRRRRKKAQTQSGAIPGPVIRLNETFTNSETRYVPLSIASLITGVGGLFALDGAYGPAAIPIAIEARALCCGTCSSIEVAIGNRGSGSTQMDLNRAWMSACTRLKIDCNGGAARVNWPADLIGKSLRDHNGALRDIVLRICGCKDTSVELYMRIWVRNGGGCTLFGGPPSALPAGGSSIPVGPTPTLTRFPIVVRTKQVRPTKTWMDLYAILKSDYLIRLEPQARTEAEAEQVIKRVLARFRINTSEEPSDVPSKPVGWLAESRSLTQDVVLLEENDFNA